MKSLSGTHCCLAGQKGTIICMCRVNRPTNVKVLKYSSALIKQRERFLYNMFHCWWTYAYRTLVKTEKGSEQEVLSLRKTEQRTVSLQRLQNIRSPHGRLPSCSIITPISARLFESSGKQFCKHDEIKIFLLLWLLLWAMFRPTVSTYFDKSSSWASSFVPCMLLPEGISEDKDARYCAHIEPMLYMPLRIPPITTPV